jgi:hypothetical protein
MARPTKYEFLLREFGDEGLNEEQIVSAAMSLIASRPRRVSQGRKGGRPRLPRMCPYCQQMQPTTGQWHRHMRRCPSRSPLVKRTAPLAA